MARLYKKYISVLFIFAHQRARPKVQIIHCLSTYRLGRRIADTLQICLLNAILIILVFVHKNIVTYFLDLKPKSTSIIHI